MKNKINVFLDDLRFPYLNPDDYSGVEKSNIYTFSSAYHYTGFRPFKDEEWIIVRNYNDFVDFFTQNVEIIKNSDLFIAYDHDLSDEHYNPDIENSEYKEKTGYDCAKWLCEYCLDNGVKYPEYYIHSMNPVGKQNIDSYIANFKKHNQND